MTALIYSYWSRDVQVAPIDPLLTVHKLKAGMTRIFLQNKIKIVVVVVVVHVVLGKYQTARYWDCSSFPYFQDLMHASHFFKL